MKILIISAYFPPKNSIASHRPYSWAKWWSKAGHDVTVLTTTTKRTQFDLNLDCSYFNVISLPVPILSKILFLIDSEKKNKKVASVHKENIFSIIIKQFSKITRKSGCFHACRFPDFHDLWARKAEKKIFDLSFDIIISSGWPYSVHRIGLIMKKKYPKTKWIVDWRDLWTHNHLFKGLKLFWFHEKHLEKIFHKNADLVTTVSEPLADILRSVTKTNVEVIYNGYDPDDFIKIKQLPRKINNAFTIVYTGTIYRGYRDPSLFFKAINNLKIKNFITSDNLRIIFAGLNADVSDLIENYQISEYYSYLGYISRENALQLQYDSDAVLFLEYNNPSVPGILTGKLFEYLYIAREIVAIGIDESTTAGKLIQDSNTGFCFSDVKKIEEYLIRKIKRKEDNYLKKNAKMIQEFERQNQAMKILDIVKKL